MAPITCVRALCRSEGMRWPRKSSSASWHLPAASLKDVKVAGGMASQVRASKASCAKSRRARSYWSSASRYCEA
jgi:hypothetical protein